MDLKHLVSECSEGQKVSEVISGFHEPGLAVVPLMLHWTGSFLNSAARVSEDVVDMSVLLFPFNSTLEKN